MLTSQPTIRPYQSYVYAYPHKTAYGKLDSHPTGRPVLRELWAAERKDALSLYLHIPFCEVRCGFCNLFTRIGAPDELTTRYLDALERQATAVRDALGDEAPVRFAAAAFGGGTPTFLTAAELDRLCDIAEQRMVPTCAPYRCRSRRRRRPRRPTGWPSSPTAGRPGSASAYRASSTPKPARRSVRSAGPMWKPPSAGSVTCASRS